MTALDGAAPPVAATGGDGVANLAVVAVTQLRGGPGGTTFALGLAAAAAEHGPSWLVEADPAGGVLVGRCPSLHGSPSLVELAFPGPGSPTDTLDLASSVAQRLGHAFVVAAPEQPAQAFECVARPRHRWPLHLRRLPGRVVVDCGRLFPGSPSLDVLRLADVVVVVTPPDGGDVYRFVQWAAGGADAVERPLLVTSGPGRYSARAVASEVGDAYLGALPVAPNDVDLLHRGASTTHRRLYRSELVRALLARLEAIDGVVASTPRRAVGS